MANSYEWFISNLMCYPEYQGQQNAVFKIVWRMDGTDGEGHFGQAYGTTPITFDPGQPFTPYDQLTPAIVVGWLEATLGQDGIAAVHEIVDRAINAQLNPVVVAPPLPWPDKEPAAVPDYSMISEVSNV
jgi:hypothetical protein